MGRRAEMRRELHKKDPTYTLTQSQIDKIKADAVEEAMYQAFILMLGIPAMIIHDKFGKLMPKKGTRRDVCRRGVRVLRQFPKRPFYDGQYP